MNLKYAFIMQTAIGTLCGVLKLWRA